MKDKRYLQPTQFSLAGSCHSPYAVPDQICGTTSAITRTQAWTLSGPSFCINTECIRDPTQNLQLVRIKNETKLNKTSSEQWVFYQANSFRNLYWLPGHSGKQCKIPLLKIFSGASLRFFCLRFPPSGTFPLWYSKDRRPRFPFCKVPSIYRDVKWQQMILQMTHW